MITLIKWYLILAGVVFTAVLVTGAWWFTTLPAPVQSFVWTVVAGTAATPASSTPSVLPAASVNGGVGDGVTAQESVLSSETPGTVSVEQATALESVGIDAAAVPATFTTEQINCFETILGATRVAEIAAGAVPTFEEFSRAYECL